MSAEFGIRSPSSSSPIHRWQSGTPPSLNLNSDCRAMSPLIRIWLNKSMFYDRGNTLWPNGSFLKCSYHWNRLGTVARQLCLPPILCPSFCPPADCVPLVLSSAPLSLSYHAEVAYSPLNQYRCHSENPFPSARFLILVPSYETDTDTLKHSRKWWYLWS